MRTPPTLEVAAPCRIDLAGGTLDVYPLYLFLGAGWTVNAAISLMGTVRIAPRQDGRLVLRSLDQAAAAESPDLAGLELDGPLGLVARAVRHYPPPCGVTVTVQSDVPHGSGLGASSALLMALSVGLRRLRQEEGPFREVIDVGANLEAQAIGVPTGKQDYYPALYGGVAALRFDAQGHAREPLCPSREAREHLAQRLVLSFTGTSRFSGASNWEVLRNYIDGHGPTRTALPRIARAAERMRTCLVTGDWAAVPDVLAEEWANRCRLADGVSSARVESLIAAASAAGARANKLCGAGGGGCMLTYAEPEHRAAVEGALAQAGADVLPYRIVEEGVRVRELVTA